MADIFTILKIFNPISKIVKMGNTNLRIALGDALDFRYNQSAEMAARVEKAVADQRIARHHLVEPAFGVLQLEKLQ